MCILAFRVDFSVRNVFINDRFHMDASASCELRTEQSQSEKVNLLDN